MKKCPVCATESPDATAFCTRCGATLSSVSPAPAPASDQPAAPIQPVPTAVVGAAGWPLPPDATNQSILGGVAPPHKSSALIILAAVGGFFVFVLIVAAIAIPNLLRSRMAANEAAAVGSLRTVNTACVVYSTEYGGFPPSLNALGGEGSSAEPSAVSAQLIDSVLQTGQKSGYLFFYSAADPDDKGVISSYAVNADPVLAGNTGRRHFFTDQSGVIRAETSGPANQNSPPIS
jgi:type IV pilus assembly protein PilA